MGGWEERRCWWCEKCSDGNERIREEVEHILLECEWYKEIREEMEEKIEREVGRSKWNQVKQREDKGMKFLLGLEEKNENITKITKETLGRSWKRRETEGMVERGRRGEHNYN